MLRIDQTKIIVNTKHKKATIYSKTETNQLTKKSIAENTIAQEFIIHQGSKIIWGKPSSSLKTWERAPPEALVWGKREETSDPELKQGEISEYWWIGVRGAWEKLSKYQTNERKGENEETIGTSRISQEQSYSCRNREKNWQRRNGKIRSQTAI